jgi:outer membrane protein assembly factor BamE
MRLVLLPTSNDRSNTRVSMPLISRLSVIGILVLLAGCTVLQGFSLRPYRMNVQQGNFLEAKDVDQIQVGMTRSQVRFLIGTPMVADPFNVARWDYVFFFKVGRTRQEISSHLTIWFEDDRVVRIDRPTDLQDRSKVGDGGFDA